VATTTETNSKSSTVYKVDQTQTRNRTTHCAQRYSYGKNSEKTASGLTGSFRKGTVRHTEGNSDFDIARGGLIDRRAQSHTLTEASMANDCRRGDEPRSIALYQQLALPVAKLGRGEPLAEISCHWPRPHPFFP
jgi:hypothetical protein